MGQNKNEFASTVKEYFESTFTLGNIVVLCFILGGFYYVTPQQIESNAQTIEHHIRNDYKPLQESLGIIAGQHEQLRREAITRDDARKFARQSDIEQLERLMREIQTAQNQRLDYIITRLDQ